MKKININKINFCFCIGFGYWKDETEGVFTIHTILLPLLKITIGHINITPFK